MTAPSKPEYSEPQTIDRVEPVARERFADVRVAAGHLVHDASNPLTSAQIASFSGVGTPSSRAEASDAAVQVVDLGRPPRLDVLQHRRLVVVRDVLARGVVDELLRIVVELDALRGGDGLALVDEAGDERAQVRALADAAVRERVSAPSGFVAALKITLRHCGPRASGTALAGMPARVHASARRSISSSGAGRGSNGPNVVSPLTSHWT